MIGKINSINFGTKVKVKKASSDPIYSRKVTPHKNQVKTDVYRKATVEAASINRALIKSGKVAKVQAKGAEIRSKAQEAINKAMKIMSSEKLEHLAEINDNNEVIREISYLPETGVYIINDYQNKIQIKALTLDDFTYCEGYDFKGDEEGSYDEGFVFVNKELVEWNKDFKTSGKFDNWSLSEEMEFLGGKLTNWSKNVSSISTSEKSNYIRQSEKDVDFFDDDCVLKIDKSVLEVDDDVTSIGEEYTYRTDGKPSSYEKGRIGNGYDDSSIEMVQFNWND